MSFSRYSSRLRDEVVGDRDLAAVAAARRRVVLVGLHVDEVDDAADLVLGRRSGSRSRRRAARSAAFSCSSVRKKSARSRSSMFTNTRRARSSSSARCHRRVGADLDAHHGVDDERPPTRTTRSAPSASAMKLGSPGVSIRLILRPSQLERVERAR